MIYNGKAQSTYFKMQELKKLIEDINIEDISDKDLLYTELIITECRAIGQLSCSLNDKILKAKSVCPNCNDTGIYYQKNPDCMNCDNSSDCDGAFQDECRVESECDCGYFLKEKAEDENKNC